MRARKLRIALAIFILLLALVSPMLACGGSQNGQQSPGMPPGSGTQNDGARYAVATEGDPIGTTAMILQDNLKGPMANQYDATNPVWSMLGNLDYWKQYCSKTTFCNSGNFQCVSFVVAVFAALGKPLPASLIGDAHQFWDNAANLPGWERIPVPLAANAKPQRGDLIGWSGGPQGFGHVAIVVDLQEPTPNADGWITFANANSPGDRFSDPAHPGNTDRMTWHANGQITTWPGYTLQGFIRQTTGRPTTIPPQFYLTSSVLQGLVNVPNENKRWEALAVASAAHYQIYPPFFVNQMYAESGLDPYQRDANGNIVKDKNGNPVPKTSPKNAIGVAQFLQSTAAGIPRCAINLTPTNPPDCGAQPGSQPPGTGIDPANPQEALPAAGYYMWHLNKHYLSYCPNQPNQTCQVDPMTAYARAFAAYNAGQGAIDSAIQRCGDATWLICSPAETQNYVIKIVGCQIAEKGGVTCSANQVV
ncbi:MAG: CHAP domain-containing protein [Chloroflexi bacterium]|nr:CHAP domain-containing protein [Chloroflexota bacterium]